MEQALVGPETTQGRAMGGAVITRAHSVWDTVPDLGPYRAQWLARVARYQMLRSYYKGTIYSDFPQLAQALKLYAGIRQIFGPLRRAVRVDVAKVPGGWTLRRDVPRPVAAAVQQVREWSRYRASYSRAVLHGAVAGEFGLLVTDDWRNKRVVIVPLRPDEAVVGRLADDTPFGLVIKQGLADRGGRYEYAMLITPYAVSVYRNGAHVETRRNLTGFVPLLLSPYLAGEDGVGENAFAGTEELLDRVNDAASQALDVIQRNAEPLTVFTGVDDVEMKANDNAVLLGNKDAKVFTVAPNLVISEAIALIDKVLIEFKNVLPQLILDALTTHNDLAYDTVLTLCMELVDHVRDVRVNVDSAIETAERWALYAGMHVGAFTTSLDVERHALDPERPVIEPTPGQRLALDAQGIGVEGARLMLASPRENTPQDGEE